MSSPAPSTHRIGAAGQQQQHQQQSPRRREEPTQAYGSSHPYGRIAAARSSPAVYQEMERGRARVPELDNEREEHGRRQPPRRSEESRRGLVKRLFDRGVDGGKPPGVKRPVISAPSAPQKVMTGAPGFP